VQLLGVHPEALVPGFEQEAVAWLYTFLRLDARGLTGPTPVAEGDDIRLEMSVIRVARDEAAHWLAERETGTGDAEDLAAWEDRAAKDESVSASRWLVRAASGPLRPGGPPRSTVESRGEFIYPTEFDSGTQPGKMFCPTAFETRNCGSSFSAQATWAADGKSALVSLSFEDVALEEIQQWPTRRNDPLFRIEQPLFRTRSFRSEVAIPLNGTRFVGLRGARSHRDGDGAGATPFCELLFLKALGTPRTIAPEARPQAQVVEAQTVVISVSSAMAARLARESDEVRRIATLWNREPGDEGRIVHVSAGTACVGGALKNSDILETIYPSEIDRKTSAADFLDLSAFETFNHGGELTLRARLMGGAEHVAVDLQWESAQPSRPTWEDYIRLGEAGHPKVPAPRFFPERAAPEETLISVDGQWHTLSFKECSAPVGSPEHGRWHAAVIRLLRVGA
jgi:hypothetical protein